MAQLFIWSSADSAWVNCQPDEITWLDRALLSNNQDLTLHRAPRCAGLRYVHRRWELFSRDTTYQVYLAPDSREAGQDHQAVRRTAQRVLPVAPAERYETLPVVLSGGAWLVSVGNWVVPLRVEVSARREAEPAPADEQPPTQDAHVWAGGVPPRGRGGRTKQDAVAHVRGYFERNPMARLAMAYYYQEFILGVAAPQTVPMTNVVIALNLSGEGAVSDYKKLLQGFIWSERGHARDLAGFLLDTGLLTPADLDEARQVAADNERSGVCEMARRRLAYRPKRN
jgi:hypothetical protein